MDFVGLDRDRDGRLARLRLERGPEPLVREQRGIDAACEIAGVSSAAPVSTWSCDISLSAFEGSRSIMPSTSRCLTWSATSCCWAPSWMFRSSSPFLILRGNEPLARRSELLDQSDVAQDKSSL